MSGWYATVSVDCPWGCCHTHRVLYCLWLVFCPRRHLSFADSCFNDDEDINMIVVSTKTDTIYAHNYYHQRKVPHPTYVFFVLCQSQLFIPLFWLHQPWIIIIKTIYFIYYILSLSNSSHLETARNQCLVDNKNIWQWSPKSRTSGHAVQLLNTRHDHSNLRYSFATMAMRQWWLRVYSQVVGWIYKKQVKLQCQKRR